MKTLPEDEPQVSEFAGDVRWELVQRINESPHLIVRGREHPGRSSHESSRAEQHPFRDEDRGRSSDSRAFGLTSSRFLLHAASRIVDLRLRFSANVMVRSHLPLRGSPGFSPGSLIVTPERKPTTLYKIQRYQPASQQVIV